VTTESEWVAQHRPADSELERITRHGVDSHGGEWDRPNGLLLWSPDSDGHLQLAQLHMVPSDTPHSRFHGIVVGMLIRSLTPLPDGMPVTAVGLQVELENPDGDEAYWLGVAGPGTETWFGMVTKFDPQPRVWTARNPLGPTDGLLPDIVRQLADAIPALYLLEQNQ
jgi:hypothetical protein